VEQLLRPLWLIVGFVATALGLAGIVLPLVPATPFFLLAAFAFARSSPRFHDWLVNHPRIGPAIRDWQREGAISRKAKRLAMIAIVATFVLSLLLGVPGWMLAVQGVVLLAVSVFILTRRDGRANGS
jgi:uncharacterized membrane protein YbaN (DUF454 family)